MIACWRITVHNSLSLLFVYSAYFQIQCRIYTFELKNDHFYTIVLSISRFVERIYWFRKQYIFFQTWLFFFCCSSTFLWLYIAENVIFSVHIECEKSSFCLFCYKLICSTKRLCTKFPIEIKTLVDIIQEIVNIFSVFEHTIQDRDVHSGTTVPCIVVAETVRWP